MNQQQVPLDQSQIETRINQLIARAKNRLKSANEREIRTDQAMNQILLMMKLMMICKKSFNIFDKNQCFNLN
jgi:hypothetical protein